MALDAEVDKVRTDAAMVIRLAREKLDRARRDEREALAELAEAEAALRAAALDAARARRQRVLMANEGPARPSGSRP